MKSNLRWLALTLALAFVSATADPGDTQRVVVTIKHGNSVALLNGKKMADPLRALSEANPEGKKPSFLLIDGKTTLHEMSNMLGIMSKAGSTKPRIFVYYKDNGVMTEITVGCSMLYSADASQIVPAQS
jgi:hypothetical protein